jgi:phosphoribosylanthranilate isomerase
MKVKLCGFTEKNSLAVAVKEKCDFLGFVFYEKSPRFITPENAALISKDVPKKIGKVAVVADFSLDQLEKILAIFKADFVQFHGEESLDFLKNFKKKFPQIKIVKAFRITKVEDLNQIKNFENLADFFMFDSGNGGSGKKFDWEILKNLKTKKDWFLSGGLNAGNIAEAIKITGAKMIDISSGIEKVRGQKSPELIEEFMAKIRQLCS